MTQSVRLIAYTEPKIDDVVSVEEFIAYCARVSNPANQNNSLTAPKLLKYLVKHKHWSPFEMAHVVLEINTTRDIGRQILRHRSFSFQEFSQRYAEVSSDMFTTREARLQDNKNRQNSIVIEDENIPLKNDWLVKQREVLKKSQEAYDWAISAGIAKEQARSVLPEGLTLSRMYMSGSLRSWIHYCLLRMEPGTQKEHREIAQMCWKELLKIFPSLGELTTEN
jgi:thymidylate synthase (FAD)